MFQADMARFIKHIITTIITLVFLAYGALAQNAFDNARKVTCTNGLLTGSYGVIGQGAVTPGGVLPPALAGSFAQVGLLNFDGQGNFKFDVVNSFNGQVQPLSTVTGKIVVNADCSVNLQDSLNISLRGTILKGGDELLLTPVSPGIAVIARAFRIKPQAQNVGDSPFERARQFTCTNGTITGTYGFDALGATTAAAGLPGPLTGAFASIGQVTYDGQGNVTLSANASFNGIPQALAAVKGTYAVNNDCTYTSRLENGATFYAVIVNEGHDLLVIQTNNGVAAVGVAKRINPGQSRTNRPFSVPGNGATDNDGGNSNESGNNTF